MKYIQNLKLVTFLMLTILLTSTVSAEVVVIVNANNTSSISDDDIKRIFLGKMKKFQGGGTILPVNLATSSDTRKAFDSTVLKKSASQIKAYWSKLVFSGKGNPPKEVSSAQEMLQLVKDNPSVIGYIDSGDVTADVTVIGKY